MQRSANETTQDWIKITYALIDEADGPIERWVIKVRSSNLEKWTVSGRVFRENRTADEVYSAIEAEIANARKQHAYVLAYQKGAKNPASSKVWSSEDMASLVEDDDGNDELPQTSLFGQAIRHNEFLFRACMKMSANMVQHLAAENEQLRGTVSDSWTARERYTQAREELMDRGLDRQIKAQREATLSHSAQAVLSMIQHWQGGGQPEQEQHATAALEQFGASLSPEQLAQLESILTPSQKLVLLGMLGASQEEQG